MAEQKKSAPTAATVQSANANISMNNGNTEAEGMQVISLGAQRIDNGVVSLETAVDLFQIVSESFESEFFSVHPGSAMEAATLNRLKMYFSSADILQSSIKAALEDLQTGRDHVYEGIRKERNAK